MRRCPCCFPHPLPVHRTYHYVYVAVASASEWGTYASLAPAQARAAEVLIDGWPDATVERRRVFDFGGFNSEWLRDGMWVSPAEASYGKHRVIGPLESEESPEESPDE